jgi:hypothetical protein
MIKERWYKIHTTALFYYPNLKNDLQTGKYMLLFKIYHHSKGVIEKYEFVFVIGWCMTPRGVETRLNTAFEWVLIVH